MTLFRIGFYLLFSLSVQAQDIKNPFSIDEDVTDSAIGGDINKETSESGEEESAQSPPLATQSKEPETEESKPDSTKLEPSIPQLSSPVIDQAKILSSKEKAALERRIRSIHQQNGPQIQILLVKDLQGFSIEEYSIKAAEKWKIGKKGKGDGVVITMSQEDRAVRIEVGDGLEGELTDLESHQIIQQKIIPEFKQGNFYKGFDSALDSLEKQFNLGSQKAGRDLSMPDNIAKVRKDKEQIKSILLPVVIFFVTFPLLFKLLGKNPLIRSVAASAYLGALTFFFVGQMFFIVLAVIFGFFVGFIGPLNFLMAAMSHRGRGRYYGGGRGGFGGGGGWSGGGGGFSGGGASGRW